MHWYGGSMAEAVTLSKQRNAIFVVFVEGDNDMSKEMATTIDNAVIVKRLSEQNNFLAVKLKSGSENYTHFAQIYQFVPVPSLFFIGRNGTPLEVVCAGVEPNNLAERMDRILQEHHKEEPAPSTSSSNIRQQTADLLQSESKPSSSSAPIVTPTPSDKSVEAPTQIHEVTKSGQEYEVICDGDVCVRKPKVGPGDAGPSQTDPIEEKPQPNEPAKSEESPVATPADSEEKVERAKELIEARRREKAEKEKELEKQKELERRSTGQGVAELKRWQADQELKQIQEERKREKMENNLARQRILQQIAQDRAERRARDVPTPSPASNPTPTSPDLSPTSGDGSGQARVQFKLPDGAAHTAHFEANARFSEVQRYVADNLQLSMTSFSLWTAFPRREINECDATLAELRLAPSAALLVLPRRQVAAPTPVTRSSVAALFAFFTQLFSSLVLQPTYSMWDWLRARVSPPPAPRAAPPPSSPPPAVRRRTNVHRLTGDTADDDNNTWNGNSTQQM